MNRARQVSSQVSSTNPDLNRVTVLAVSSEVRDHTQLRHIFGSSNWQLCGAYSCREAVSRLHENTVAVVICASKLSDGTWQSLMDVLCTLEPPPIMIVAGDFDDGLWADVLQNGAYDFLCKPFHQQEVTRIISLAWLQWREQVVPNATRLGLESQSRATSLGLGLFPRAVNESQARSLSA
jgi:DNA-binding NtrC family response regulator